MATTINAGRVAMVPKGEWSATTAYVRLDVVSYHGSSYVCKQDGTGQTPDTATNYWQLLSSGLDPTVDTISAKHYEGSTVTAETSISAAGVISKTASGVTKTYDLPAESGTLATASQVAAKQDALVSGTNIKTVNGTSVLGSGNVVVKGVSDVSAPATADGTWTMTLDNGDTITIDLKHVHNKSVVISAESTITLDAHIIYDLGTVAGNKTINLPSTVDAGAEYEFRLAYTSGDITLPSGVVVANDATLSFTAGKTYQVIISGGILYYSETTVS